jgi:hypothetical protein
MTWINRDEFLNRKTDIKIDFNADLKLKSYEDYLNENFFYKLGKLYKSLVGTKFMCYEGDNLITKTITEVKFNTDVVYDEERKTYVEDKNKFVAMHELPIPNDYTGYKLFVYVVSEDDKTYDINEIYFKPEK